MANTMSEYDPWSVISTSGRRSLSGLNTRSTKCRVSFAAPETTRPASPTRWSLIMLSQVTPFLRAKYFGFARASMLRTGTTKRTPSTAATIPPPHTCANGMPACASMSAAFASA
jgi:hypothetical protein